MLTARSMMIVEQGLPPSDLIDRPSLALDPGRVREFAKWLEQQSDWASHMKSFDLEELSDDVRDEMKRFYASPNLWEVGTQGALDPSRRKLDRAEAP